MVGRHPLEVNIGVRVPDRQHMLPFSLMGVISRSLLILVLVFVAGMAFIHYGSDLLGSLSTVEYLVIGVSFIAVGTGSHCHL
jgi:hypothetical protein